MRSFRSQRAMPPDPAPPNSKHDAREPGLGRRLTTGLQNSRVYHGAPEGSASSSARIAGPPSVNESLQSAS
eukprot:7905748-Alexandrium_andersonii.AAC.1